MKPIVALAAASALAVCLAPAARAAESKPLNLMQFVQPAKKKAAHRPKVPAKNVAKNVAARKAAVTPAKDRPADTAPSAEATAQTGAAPDASPVPARDMAAAPAAPPSPFPAPATAVVHDSFDVIAQTPAAPAAAANPIAETTGAAPASSAVTLDATTDGRLVRVVEAGEFNEIDRMAAEPGTERSWLSRIWSALSAKVHDWIG